jgi:hypothetical protein
VVSFTPWPLYLQGKSPGTHWIGGWVGPRAVLYIIIIIIIASFEAFTAMIFLVEVFWLVTPCSVVVGGGIMDLRNVGILPQHYTASQTRRT